MMRHVFARVLNRLVRPFGIRCVPVTEITAAVELPEKSLQNSRILPNRSDILKLLPKGGRVSEVGVAFGRYSRKIIDVIKPEQFVAIDTFELDRRSWSGYHAYKNILEDLSHENFYKKEFDNEIASGKLIIKKGYSYEVLEDFPDQYFDMIYIDAAHDYDSVRKDLYVAGRKIKSNGFLVLNDYTIIDPLLLQPYGIVQATNEFCISEGWEVRYLALHRYMFCDVALTKIKL